MVFPRHCYSEAGISGDFCLIQMSDFNSLIAISQDCQTPVFALTPEQIKQSGTKSGRVLTGRVLTTALDSQLPFRNAFSTLANKVIHLTSNAVCA